MNQGNPMKKHWFVAVAMCANLAPSSSFSGERLGDERTDLDGYESSGRAMEPDFSELSEPEDFEESSLRFQCVYTSEAVDRELRFHRSEWLESRDEAKRQASDRCREANRDAWMSSCAFHRCRSTSG